jgi:peroxiredoxin Q/BCP
MLQPGDTAPAFELPSQTGELVRLGDFRGRQNVVLYFYPKDNTPVCTREACAFRDSYEQFASKETAVIGVSSDSSASHEAFALKHNVPFPLLADVNGALQRAYGVGRVLGFMPSRVTFVIDKKGVIRGVFSALFQAGKHVEEALQTLETVHSD